MRPNIVRYVLLSGAAVALLISAIAVLPSIRAESAPYQACKNNPTAQCLTDLGVDLAKSARTLPSYMPGIVQLAQMGRMREAYDLEVRVLKGKDHPPENIEASANRQLASHRITAAIRNGIDLETAIAQTPAVDPGTLWISALDLLGRRPYGPGSKPKTSPDDQVLGPVSEIAKRIAKMALEGPERSQTSGLMHAAELQVALGNRAEVIQLLESLQQTSTPDINPSKDLIRLVGAPVALQLFGKAGATGPNILLNAASVETDQGLATTYLKDAFVKFSSDDQWPDFDFMERTVQRATQVGLQSHAQELAQEMATLADTAPAIFPVFPHIYTAHALLIAGVDEGEVRHRLEHAQSLFPKNENAVVGLGVVSGPIVWGSSGLEAAARRELAKLWARLGEIDKTIQIMEGIDDPVFAWNDILTSDIPIATLDALLDAAKDVMSNEDYAYTQALHAQEMLKSGRTEEQHDWARKITLALVHAEQMNGYRADVIYTTLARNGARLQDQDIQVMALDQLAKAALASRDFNRLISAGFEWHQSPYMP